MEKYMTRLREFLLGTIAELNKCTWPERRELFESTLLVITTIVILTGYIFVVDIIFRAVINAITGSVN